MAESRITVSTADLTKTFNIWLTVIRQRRPSLLRDLWTRRGEEHDGEKIRSAQVELARELAERLKTAKWEVSRNRTSQDAFWETAGSSDDG
jgi:hypothetical protein